jgi:hypothetical protein
LAWRNTVSSTTRWLPFLLMLPLQLLIQDLLYDLSQSAIPAGTLLGYCGLTQVVKMWYIRRFGMWL